MRRFKPEEVEFSLTADHEDIPLEGAFHFDDEELERETINAISERLERGDVWAWAAVTVTARWAGFKGTAHIGGCNYTDEDDFKKNSGYFKDMLLEALNDLMKEITSAGWTLDNTLEDLKKAVAKEIG